MSFSFPASKSERPRALLCCSCGLAAAAVLSGFRARAPYSGRWCLQAWLQEFEQDMASFHSLAQTAPHKQLLILSDEELYAWTERANAAMLRSVLSITVPATMQSAAWLVPITFTVVQSTPASTIFWPSATPSSRSGSDGSNGLHQTTQTTARWQTALLYSPHSLTEMTVVGRPARSEALE